MKKIPTEYNDSTPCDVDLTEALLEIPLGPVLKVTRRVGAKKLGVSLEEFDNRVVRACTFLDTVSEAMGEDAFVMSFAAITGFVSSMHKTGMQVEVRDEEDDDNGEGDFPF